MPFRIFEDGKVVVETTSVNKIIEYIDRYGDEWDVKMLEIRENIPDL